MSLLAASGGDTVKLFDASDRLFDSSVKPGDPCTLSFTPTAGSQVNSVKWNHTNLVVASAGDDKRISLWRKNGQSMGTIVAGTDSVDNIEFFFKELEIKIGESPVGTSLALAADRMGIAFLRE
ncbi:protein NEDD1-like [Trifolium pratense]|uniref:Protein NEDD1-like n=1 Tax=Trifolium pratense TaxID=57577 RepID=A0A2K3MXT6_TRIPR|nr:protein NEDD1-like [Trifolium pratense]